MVARRSRGINDIIIEINDVIVEISDVVVEISDVVVEISDVVVEISGDTIARERRLTVIIVVNPIVEGLVMP